MDSAAARRTVLLIATLGSFITPFMGSSVNIALPAIASEFDMSAVLLGWVATGYLLTAAMFLVPFGRIADIKGRKKIFTYGIALYTVTSFLSAIAPSGLALISFRVLQGVGGAMIFGTGVAILTSVFPPGERGKVLGINVAAVYTGLSVGPFLGGLLTQYLGWRSIFWVTMVLGLLMIALVLWKLKGEWAEAKQEKFDLPGSVVYGLALLATIYGFSLLPALWGGGLILVGVLGILTFVWWELRVESPVFEMRLFQNNTVFALSSLAALINYSATFAVGFLLSLYLQYIRGFSPQHAGLILVAQPVIQAVFSPFAGRLSDKVEPRIVASAGMSLTVLGLVFLVFLDAGTRLELIIAALVILGFGFALFSSPNVNAVMSSVERRFYGVASATMGTMRLTGQMLSMGVAMLILALYMGRTAITPEHYPQFLDSARVAFGIFAALCFGGIFASLARGKVR